MFKVPWTKGNYISDYTCKDWIRPYIEFPVVNGLRQVKIKAGCKAYYPNGFDENNNPVYSILTLQNDANTNSTGSYTSDADRCLQLVGDTQCDTAFARNYCIGSSPELTPIGGYCCWWDTTNNILKETSDAGTNWNNSTRSFPIGWLKWTAGIGYTSFTPFEFCGCMGNGVFVLPNFTLNFPNGRDSSGEGLVTPVTCTTINFKSYTASSNVSNGTVLFGKNSKNVDMLFNNNVYYQDAAPANPAQYWYWYDTLNNMIKYCNNSLEWVDTGWGFIGNFTWDGTTKRITNFKPFTTIDELSKYYF